jgi:hypothetical protein
MTETTNLGDNFYGLLALWQAFSDMQQHAFAFLAAEALATGQEFESSTEGAAQVLTRFGSVAATLDPDEMRKETWSVVRRLQSADRSRQGLEQVASVLETLSRLHSELVEATCRHHPLPAVDGITTEWINALGGCVTISDWRRRFNDALHGRDPGPRGGQGDEADELF